MACLETPANRAAVVMPLPMRTKDRIVFTACAASLRAFAMRNLFCGRGAFQGPTRINLPFMRCACAGLSNSLGTPSGHLFPPLHDDVTIRWVEFHEEGLASHALCRDERKTRPTEQI